MVGIYGVRRKEGKEGGKKGGRWAKECLLNVGREKSRKNRERERKREKERERER